MILSAQADIKEKKKKETTKLIEIVVGNRKNITEREKKYDWLNIYCSYDA
jgi:hypothetical protein